MNRQGGAQIYTGNGNDLLWIGGYQEGQEPGTLWVFQADGLYKNDSEIPNNYGSKTIYLPRATTRALYGKSNWAAMTEAEKIASRGLPIQPGGCKMERHQW